MPSTLQQSDYYDCLLAFYFGRKGDELELCLNRAYGDFKRTLHGIANHTRRDEVRTQADQFLKETFASIQKMRPPTQAQFDDWHRCACFRLAAIYRKHNYASFSVGQAQKWLNMTFKYIYVFTERRLPGFDHLYDLCHAPLDRDFIKSLLPYGFQRLPCEWSRLNKYETYLERQKWLRSKFKLAPLDAEILIWMGRPLPPDMLRDS
jgi:hypothetical protein